jgi:uncharacterized protein YndB with AHSA1/START domain
MSREIGPITVKSERVVARTAATIWKMIEPAENLAMWFPMAGRSELVHGHGLGRVQRMFGEWGRKPVQIDQEIIEYSPNRLLSWKHTQEFIAGRPAPRISRETIVTVRLEPLETGTRIVLQSRSVPASIFKAILIKLVVRPRIRKALDQALETLTALPV